MIINQNKKIKKVNRKPNKALLKHRKTDNEVYSHKEETFCDAEKNERKTNPFFYDTCNTLHTVRNKGKQLSQLWLI